MRLAPARSTEIGTRRLAAANDLGWSTRSLPGAAAVVGEDAKHDAAARARLGVDRHLGLKAAIRAVEIVGDPRGAVHAQPLA